MPDTLQPEWPPHDEVAAKDKANRTKQSQDFNRRHAAHQLRPLADGEDVWVQDMSCAAKVLSPARRPRSYVVETPTGIIQRNRRHLVPFNGAGMPDGLASDSYSSTDETPAVTVESSADQTRRMCDA